MSATTHWSVYVSVAPNVWNGWHHYRTLWDAVDEARAQKAYHETDGRPGVRVLVSDNSMPVEALASTVFPDGASS